MKIGMNEKLLMIGDSITDCERKRPIGEGRGAGVGKGYVSLVEVLLNTFYPDRSIRVVNMGWGGNKVRDLKERWQTDVIDLKPDWLSVMIGINDVWRQFDDPLMKEIHVLPDEYESTLRKLVADTRPLVKGLILMTPYFLEPNRDDAMRRMMDSYGLIVKRIAEENECLFIDTQAAFDEFLAHTHPAALAADRIHPNLTGHMVLARAFLNTIGFEWK